jgi:uncharacterized protein (TIGR01777 family)
MYVSKTGRLAAYCKRAAVGEVLMKIVIPGGSGFLGQSLGHYFAGQGQDVVVLSRAASAGNKRLREVQWDGKTPGAWVKEIDGADAIFNCTGKSVNCIYNERNRKEILESRIHSVRVLHQAIKECQRPPALFCQTGSLAIYGDSRRDCDESAPHGKGFSVEVCESWEDEFFKVTHRQTRMCMYRIGFALGKAGGALASLIKLTKFFLGGTVGSGKQYISWLHIHDLNAMFEFAINNEETTGIYNATSPSPVTNREFMKTLRKVLHRPWSPPVPAPLVKLGARLVMRTESELALTGRKCFPKRFLDEGFQFQYTDLENALRNIMNDH